MDRAEKATAVPVPTTPAPAAPVSTAKPAGGNGTPAPVATKEEVRARTAGKFSWCKHGDRWCARGPRGAVVGEEVEVERKNGTSSRETLRCVVRQYDDAWIYAVE
jgi:hypothetical protein